MNTGSDIKINLDSIQMEEILFIDNYPTTNVNRNDYNVLLYHTIFSMCPLYSKLKVLNKYL